MPTELQLTLTGEPAAPPQALGPFDVARCVGGCDRQLTRADLHPTPEGLLCDRCLADLYTMCDDCGRMLRFDDWGECADLREGPDGVDRCVECHNNRFSHCNYCGRLTLRDSGRVYHHPDNPAEEYCRSCWEANWFECTGCGGTYHRRDCHMGVDTPLCLDCFDQDYVHCSHCGNAIVRGEHRGWEGDPYCEHCYGRADTWKVQPWSGRATSFGRVGSERRFGVELETETCDGWRELHGDTEWGCVYECSTPGKEFVSPILQGDEGFAEVRDFCRIAERRDWTVDRSCGLHIHLDLSGDSSDECLRIAYAYRKTYPMWKKFVTSRRGSNSMCGSPQYSSADIRTCEHIEDFAEARDRFEFVNWRSFIRHGSFEVRLYDGTLNAREVCNWIALHARFMDRVKGMTYNEIDERFGAITRKNWAGLCAVIEDTDLLDYWRRKAYRHGNELPALWDGQTSPDGVVDDGIVERDGRLYVSDRLLEAGEADLDDLTEGNRYRYEYQPASRMYVIFTDEEPSNPVPDEDNGMEPEPSDFDDVDYDDDWDEDGESGTWCEICQRYH